MNLLIILLGIILLSVISSAPLDLLASLAELARATATFRGYVEVSATARKRTRSAPEALVPRPSES